MFIFANYIHCPLIGDTVNIVHWWRQSNVGNNLLESPMSANKVGRKARSFEAEFMDLRLCGVQHVLEHVIHMGI